MLQNAFPLCTSEDLSRGKFPWSNPIDNDGSESGKFYDSRCASPFFTNNFQQVFEAGVAPEED